MADDFFEEKKDDKEVGEKVKVGEKEYSQDELSNLVGLGETAKEYETKWNRKISEFYPDYTQKSQKLSDYEKKDAERQVILEKQEKEEEEKRQEELEERARAGKLSPEEIKQAALREARELGLLTREDFNEEVRKEITMQKTVDQLKEDTQIAVEGAKEKYGISTNNEDVWKHMKENGYTKPDKAIKDMFEQEIDKWKEEQLLKARPRGFTTQEGTEAGGKQPPERKRLTKDKLGDAIVESLTRTRGGQ